MEQSLPTVEGRLGSWKTGGGGMIVSVIPVPCWGHFHVIVQPQDFAWQVWLVVRPLKAWWHHLLQLVSEHVGAVSSWIPQLIFEEHIQQKTGFSSIGRGPGLVLTSPKKSNNFEISLKLLKMIMGTNFWNGERKMGAECGNWMLVEIRKYMVTREIGRMQEWCNDVIKV